MNKHLVAALICLGCTATVTAYCIKSSADYSYETELDGSEITSVYVYANENKEPEASETVPEITLPIGYDEKLSSLLRRNPDTAEFVEGYAESYGTYETGDLECTSDPVTGGVPLLMQWDSRWGYMEYGSDCMGFTGCGPTCLSMVASYLLNDPSLTPQAIAEYSIANGYCIEGAGTAWDLMEIGATDLGLESIPITVDEERIIANLEAGNPIIAIVGPGDFTYEGHFIVLVGYEDGLIRVNDPNSYVRSEQGWSYDDLAEQIEALWVYRV